MAEVHIMLEAVSRDIIPIDHNYVSISVSAKIRALNQLQPTIFNQHIDIAQAKMGYVLRQIYLASQSFVTLN